jgi:catechol 2,3-dioxygenase-like lactoylglutathione lyase family enzyme
LRGVHHLALTVRSLDASVRWYTQVFGLTKVMEEPHAGGGAVILRHPSSGLYVGLHTHEASQGELFSETRTGLDHASFGVPSRAALDAWQAHLDALGVEHSAISDQRYGSVLVLRDPDNIQLELISNPGT